MKLSAITIGALMLAQVQAGAQTKAQNPKPVKQTGQDSPKTSQDKKPKKKNTALAKDSVKPVNKNPDHYYCPPCGMG